MFIAKNKISRIHNPILIEGKYVFDNANVISKMSFITNLQKKFNTSSNVDKEAIYNLLFTFSRDINPKIRVKSLSILSSIGVPSEMMDEAMSKEKMKKSKKVSKSHIGVIEACLEDAYPEVRAEAIKVIVSKANESQTENAFKAVTQMISDGSAYVRNVAIFALSNLCKALKDYIHLEDNQLSVILPMLIDFGSTFEEKRNILDCISFLETISISQTQKVLECLLQFNDKCSFFFDYLIYVVYCFGYNNSHFFRLVAEQYLRTKSTARNEINHIKMVIIIAILSAHRKYPFPISPELQEASGRYTPLLTFLEKQRQNKLSPKSEETSIDLDKLKYIIDNSLQSVQEIINNNQSYKDSVEYIKGNKSPSLFVVNNVSENLYSVKKYKVNLLVPEPNTKFKPAQQFYQDFKLKLIGTIDPVPPPNYKFIIQIETPLSGLINPNQQIRIEIPVNENGEFNSHPSMNFPVFRPFCKIQIVEILITDKGEEIIINDKPIERFFALY